MLRNNNPSALHASPLWKAAFFMALLASASLFAEGGERAYTVKDRFNLKMNDLQIAVDPESAFTLREIKVAGKPLLLSVGFGGFVMAYPEAKFIGSGHTEGGREAVESVTLKVDGKEIELPFGQTLDVIGEAVLTKSSRLNGDVVLHTELRLTPDVIEEKVRAEITGDAEVDYVYPFMYSWTPSTELWMAETETGEVIEGAFDCGGDWELNKNVRWSSVYDPKDSIAASVVYSGDLPKGSFTKFWDLDRYHKQYFVLTQKKGNLPKGEVFELSAKVHISRPADETEWKNKTLKVMTDAAGQPNSAK